MNSYRAFVLSYLLVWGVTSSGASRDGFVQLMSPSQQAAYQTLMPRVEDSDIDSLLRDAATMWYDQNSIVPGYQDSMGDPRGFRPNTIESILIDLAVPGGWKTLFLKKGTFNFPFASGGADDAENMEKINFWSVPRVQGGALPVVYWKLNFSRWRWMFPVGTVIGEVLMVKMPDGDKRVFEIRVRKREQDHWSNRIYRPFPTAWHLAEQIKRLRPEWFLSAELKNMIQKLMDETTLTSRTLQTKSYPGTFDTHTGYVDILPEFSDPSLVKDLLTQSQFLNMTSMTWKSAPGKISYAPTTRSSYSIVPKNYDAGVLAVDDVSCRRCHKDAGRQIGEFHPDLVLYGELWGEDETFSWHPFDTKSFVKTNGDVANFNDDNRRLREDFVNAGLIKLFNPSVHPNSVYKELPRDWKYKPFR